MSKKPQPTPTQKSQGNSGRSRAQPNTRNTAQKITKRRWIDCIPVWSEFTPNFSNVGSLPDPTMSNFFAANVTVESYDGQQLDIPGIHTIALLEAIFLFQKSVHVARSIESASDNGMRSWSVYQAYHCAYYAAKSIMILNGACFPQPQGRQLLLDLFPVQEKQKVRQFRASRTIFFTSMQALEHKIFWQIFGRIMTVVQFNEDFQKLSGFLVGVDYENISKPRNRFIYREDYWPFEDLINLNPVKDFAYLADYPNDLTGIDDEDPRFLILLGMVLPAFLRLMMDQLADAIPALRPHIDYMDQADWQDSTGMLRSFFQPMSMGAS